MVRSFVHDVNAAAQATIPASCPAADPTARSRYVVSKQKSETHAKRVALRNKIAKDITSCQGNIWSQSNQELHRQPCMLPNCCASSYQLEEQLCTADSRTAPANFFTHRVRPRKIAIFEDLNQYATNTTSNLTECKEALTFAARTTSTQHALPPGRSSHSMPPHLPHEEGQQAWPKRSGMPPNCRH